jgi:hypothetical protein
MGYQAKLFMEQRAMTRDDIIRMAREAGWHDELLSVSFTEPLLEQFAALVSAAERDRMKAEGWRQCANGQRTTQYCGLLEDAVKTEREQCALIAEPYEPICDRCPSGVANAIRGRRDELQDH